MKVAYAGCTRSPHLGEENEIKEINVAKEVNVLTKHRSQAVEDVEKLLLV